MTETKTETAIRERIEDCYDSIDGLWDKMQRIEELVIGCQRMLGILRAGQLAERALSRQEEDT